MSQRTNFGKIHEVAEPPNLIEIQLRSYEEFLQKNILPSKRKDLGLQAVFREVFPITSYDEKMTLDFVMYEIGEPKLDRFGDSTALGHPTLTVTLEQPELLLRQLRGRPAVIPPISR